WNIRAQEGAEDVLPLVSQGPINVNAAAPVHAYKTTDPASAPGEVPDPALVMRHLEEGLVELGIYGDRGEVPWTRRPSEPGAIDLAANPVWVLDAGEEKVQWQRWRTLGAPGGRVIPQPAKKAELVKQTWNKALDDYATLGGFAAGTLG